MVQPWVRAAGALQQLCEANISFPFLLLFASLLLASPLRSRMLWPFTCTTSYSCCDIILKQGYNACPGLFVGIRTPVDYSWVSGVQPKGLHVCTCRIPTINCQYSAKNDLEASLDAVCTRSGTKMYQDPIPRPPYPVVLATSCIQI